MFRGGIFEYGILLCVLKTFVCFKSYELATI